MVEDCSFSSHFRSRVTSVVLLIVAFILTVFVLTFSLFSTAIFEACCFFVGHILDVFLKLLAVFVGRLGSFSPYLMAVFFTVIVSHLGSYSLLLSTVWKLLAALVGSTCCFAVGHFCSCFN